MRNALIHTVSRVAPLLLALTGAACSGTPDDSPVTGAEDDLTSNSARTRSLRFDGYVYVEVGASEATILSTVQKQTQTMFGPLRTAEIGVNNRELKAVDASTFVKTQVTVIDTKVVGDKGKPMQKVRYRYKDTAVVPVAMAKRSAITLAVMNPGYASQKKRILGECTENDAEAQDFQDSIWYVFDASLSSCNDAIAAEQEAIDLENAKLTDKKTQVSAAEVARLYIPTTVSLGADKTNKGTDYPEYDRLYAGGVEPGKLVIGLVNGFLDHEHPTGEVDDSGFPEWLEELRETMKGGPAYAITKVEPAEDLTTFSVNGKTVKSTGIKDIIAWQLDGKLPAGLGNADKKALKAAVGKKTIKHWITLEAPVKVKIGSAAEKTVTIKFNTYFGAEGDNTPHKRAIKTSDIFVYNGHSYIGYGPLDPSRFSAGDFPASYQIMFIDGCVSYNYYEKDYFPLKTGGTKNLELITNGLEAPAWKSGYALGRFLETLLDGSAASYKDLLAAAEDTDSLRVVDGEVDNKYTPASKPLKVTW
ncbi:MAG: hypothetical protein ABI193_08955 [Minicystis sp.]